VSRAKYAGYLVSRIAEALGVALCGAFLADILQHLGMLGAAHWKPAWLARDLHSRADFALAQIEWWAWPATWAVVAHILLGPKQTRPIYLKIPGAMYAYAGVKVDRNAGCRGGCVTGATGSGKTLACILPRLHSLCINESGVARREWSSSPERRDFEKFRKDHRDTVGKARREIASITTSARREVSKERGSEERVGRLRCLCEHSAMRLQEASDPFRRQRYRVPPWGGFICGEKGNEWQFVEELLRVHGREEDLCILRTRPPWAPRDWAPSVRLNLISMDSIPADTYAKMIVETGLAVEEAGTRDEFFVPQARDKIAWGIRLVRAVKAVGATQPGVLEENPGLLTLLDILTVQESYRRYLVRCTGLLAALSTTTAFTEARYQLENNYWNQPPDQLGGVRSTLYNFLIPFAEPEIAEVFCSDSTFDLREIQAGKVVCLAIPQKFSLQRRYVATFLKTLAYQIILERFDQRADHPDWSNRNVILVEQDEWQRHAVRSDCEVDVVREAAGAVYAATQSQNSVWLRLGGREKAAPLIANLRNRWICQAATEECAEESSNLVSGRVSRDVSYSHGDGGRTTNVSFSERPFLPRRELRTLPPFHVVFAPAEGPWLYRKCIAMPATPDGGIPRWWFGDWNPLHWVVHFLGLPEMIGGLRLRPKDPFVPPWRASAPFRAQLRRICGLDGTFIILGGKRSGAASDADR
jgi:hypothetical protein